MKYHFSGNLVFVHVLYIKVSQIFLAKLLCTIKLTFHANTLIILTITRHANTLLIFKTHILHVRVCQFTCKYSPIQNRRQMQQHSLGITLPAKYKL